MKNLPANLMTSGNLFCGLSSIIMAIDGHFQIAAWLIIFASIFDAFDGKIARLFGGGSDFGLQFDSLADMTSFGVAPSVLIYRVAFQDLEFLGLLVTFIPTLFAAIRLARFNVTATGKAHDFVGLSSPLHAILVASFVAMSMVRWGEIVDSNVLAGLVLLTSLLMVSRLPMPGLPKFTLREPGTNLLKMIVLLVAVLLIAISPGRNTFPVLSVLVFSAFVFGVVHAVMHRNDEDEDELDEDEESESVPIYRGRR